MVLGKVIGNVWATKKDDALSGYKLMVIELINSKQESISSEIVAVDTIGAGVGDVVLVARGSSSRMLNGKRVNSPIDAAVVGIVDDIERR